MLLRHGFLGQRDAFHGFGRDKGKGAHSRGVSGPERRGPRGTWRPCVPPPAGLSEWSARQVGELSAAAPFHGGNTEPQRRGPAPHRASWCHQRQDSRYSGAITSRDGLGHSQHTKKEQKIACLSHRACQLHCNIRALAQWSCRQGQLNVMCVLLRSGSLQVPGLESL